VNDFERPIPLRQSERAYKWPATARKIQLDCVLKYFSIDVSPEEAAPALNLNITIFIPIALSVEKQTADPY